MQRVGVIGGRGDLCTTAARFFGGPLGGTNGGDNGSTMLTAVSAASYPAANAVNDGARRGLRMLKLVGRHDDTTDKIVVRVAIFATKFWRTLNGDSCSDGTAVDGVCAGDAQLRCSLLSLWQWIWPKSCFALLRVQGWKSAASTPRYKEIGAHFVMKVSEEERQASSMEEAAYAPFNKVVQSEIDRQLIPFSSCCRSIGSTQIQSPWRRMLFQLVQ